MLFLFLLISLINLTFSYNTILIKTNDGTVKGVKETALYSSDQYYAFRGIPYAQPPVGDLRFLVRVIDVFWIKIFSLITNIIIFKPPKPAQPRDYILDAGNFTSKCVQYKDGNEDCLYLNIYTPGV